MEAADRLPAQLAPQDRSRLLTPLCKNKWITITHLIGDGSLGARETLRLTDTGRAVLRHAVESQDATAVDPPGVTLDEKRRRRGDLRRAVYDAAGGSTGPAVSVDAVAASLGWDLGTAKPVVRYPYMLAGTSSRAVRRLAHAAPPDEEVN